MPVDESNLIATIDYLVPTQISKDIGPNELGTLDCLAMGLNLIAATVWQIEEPLRCRDREANLRTAHFGNVPGTDPRQILLLPCYFHWFGVSLCNYIRLVGFLAALKSGAVSRQDLEDKGGGHKRIGEACKAYVNGVTEIQEVLIWRNKVAAHFAITNPRGDDNLSTLDMSVMYPVSYSDGRYRVGEWQLTRSREGTPPVQSQIATWSITDVYERIVPRYWPSFRWPQTEKPTATSAPV